MRGSEFGGTMNARNLQLECEKVLHKGFIRPALVFGGETMLWKEKEEFRIGRVQMDRLLFGKD